MRNSICSTEVASRFSRTHRHVLRAIKKLIKEDLNASAFFSESEYTSQQNKKLPCYDMTFSGFSLLTDTWGFSRGAAAPVKAAIIGEFGESCVVLSSARTRREDCFYEMLTDIFPFTKILRQYHIAGYRADFYMPEHFLFIEFDEEQHFSDAAKKKDTERWESIRGFIAGNFDDKVELIRVDVGNELRGIGAIAGYMAMTGLNATCVTRLYDSYKSKIE
ncbi:MAG: Rha family transcriptional regulator [Plesiomonas sp.]